jgi:hypothetical protein
MANTDPLNVVSHNMVVYKNVNHDIRWGLTVQDNDRIIVPFALVLD